MEIQSLLKKTFALQALVAIPSLMLAVAEIYQQGAGIEAPRHSTRPTYRKVTFLISKSH